MLLILREYLDYATVHGMARTKNTPYMPLKCLWVLALLGSFGMIAYQVSKLYGKLQNLPISTSVEYITAKKIEFPTVTICNNNPLQYSYAIETSELDDIIFTASMRYGVDLDTFNYQGKNGFDKNQTNETGEFTDYGTDNILWKTTEAFRMMMSKMNTSELDNLSQPMTEFILLCNFAGWPCASASIKRRRTYQYGMCYDILAKEQRDQGGDPSVAVAGKSFGLELLLHVDQPESVPFVSSATGVRFVITKSDTDFVDMDNAISVPTGFEINVAVSQANTYDPDQTDLLGVDSIAKCNETLGCEHSCQQQHYLIQCRCYQYYFQLDDSPPDGLGVNASAYKPCTTPAELKCIDNMKATFITSRPTHCSVCRVPCKETTYNVQSSLVAWPDLNYMPILQQILYAKLTNKPSAGNASLEYARANLMLLRIYLTSMTSQTVKEEYTYDTTSFFSDVGGTLGLWAGFSVLSVLEVFELIVLLVAGAVNRRNKTTVQDLEKCDLETTRSVP